MKILQVHNAYLQRGGEDAVADDEAELLRRHGHCVQRYARHNEELETLSAGRAALEAVWSRRSQRELEALLLAGRPDVIHVHNTVPRISPSIYWSAARLRIPVVQTLHNFRLLCPQALMLREEKVCEDCLGKPLAWPGVVHGCYRGSRAQTAVLAASTALHRGLGTWQSKVTRYIALSHFAEAKYIAGGLPAPRLRIKPNFVDLPAAPAPTLPRQGLLFVGRLSHEKGLQVLLQALAQLGPAAPPLRVVGSGPLAASLPKQAGVTYLGALPPAAVYAEMRQAQLLLLPSICFENFPRTLVEAFACGLPVLASRLGALPELIQEGLTGALAAPGDAGAWGQSIRALMAEPQRLEALGQAARAHYAKHWTPEQNLQQLLAIYEDAIAAQALSAAA